MSAVPPVPGAVPPYRDRYAGLVFFGVVEILIGLFALLMVPLILLAARLTANAGMEQGMSTRNVLPSAGIYLAISASFITLGVGSILPRRWARALMLVLSVFWLVVGAVSLLLVVAVVPRMLERMPGNATGAPSFIVGFIFLIFAFIYLVLPIVFFLFYRSPNVKLTCDARDPRPRWTDSRPLPVLGLCLVLGISGVFSPFGAFLRVIPFLGRIYTGWPVTLFYLLFGATSFLLAVGAYRRRLWAWWGALLFALGGNAYLLLTFPRLDSAAYLRALGYADAEVQRLDMTALWGSPLVIATLVVAAIGWAGFVLWLRRYFDAGQVTE